MAAGGELDLLTGLGNGSRRSNDARRPLLVGGGVGVPPLYNLAKKLLARGKAGAAWCWASTRRRRSSTTRSSGRWAARSPSRRSTVRGASGASSRRPSPNGDWISTTFTPAGRCRCCMRLCNAVAQDGQLSFEERMGADSAPAWAVRAKPNTATNVSARRGRYLRRGDHMVRTIQFIIKTAANT